jgi:TonB family protein
METHTTPPYPVESVQQHEEGAVLLQVSLGADGVPTETKTEKSSGFPRLDEAAGAWVKKQWRWQPLRQNCSVVTRVSINWSLNGFYPLLLLKQPYDGESITRALLEEHH